MSHGELMWEGTRGLKTRPLVSGGCSLFPNSDKHIGYYLGGGVTYQLTNSGELENSRCYGRGG